MATYKNKVYEGKIAESCRGWYKDLAGSKVRVIKFTHNYYRDADIPTRTYDVRDVKIIKEI